MVKKFNELDKWDQRFIKLAIEVKNWSKDPRTKVGCVIVNDRKRVISLGFNGFPSGIEDTPERLNNREIKNKLMAHAERNAFDNNDVNFYGSTLYTTYFPCHDCSKSIIQNGVKRVVAPIWDSSSLWDDSFSLSIEMLKEVGIIVDVFDDTSMEF